MNNGVIVMVVFENVLNKVQNEHYMSVVVYGRACSRETHTHTYTQTQNNQHWGDML